MFAESGLESIAFPSTLKEIPPNSFWAAGTSKTSSLRKVSRRSACRLL